MRSFSPTHPPRATATATATTSEGVGVSEGEEASRIRTDSRERIFYHPIVNNLSIHVRCMLSLWEGLIGNLLTPGGGGGEMSGSMSESSSMDSGEKGWSKELID